MLYIRMTGFPMPALANSDKAARRGEASVPEPSPNIEVNEAMPLITCILSYRGDEEAPMTRGKPREKSPRTEPETALRGGFLIYGKAVAYFRAPMASRHALQMLRPA